MLKNPYQTALGAVAVVAGVLGVLFFLAAQSSSGWIVFSMILLGIAVSFALAWLVVAGVNWSPGAGDAQRLQERQHTAEG